MDDEDADHDRDAGKEIAPDDDEGSTRRWQSHLLFIPTHGTMTREAYVPNERIVDHSTTGVPLELRL